nr:probable inactive purple acid phosphatase 1 [Tanacetum cinerariifolium]
MVEGVMNKVVGLSLVVWFCVLLSLKEVASHGDHAFANIGIYRVTLALTDDAYVEASPTVLGSKVTQGGLYTRVYAMVEGVMNKVVGLSLIVWFCVLLSLKEVASHGDHAFANIGIYQVTLALTDDAYVEASPTVLGSK